jgi:hypothetical protein
MARDHQRDNNVYVLGAGFSRDAGLPLVAGFLQAARELYDRPGQHLSSELYAHFDSVFKFRQETRHARDIVNLRLEDIEVLFSLAEMSALLRGRSRSGILRSVRHLIGHTVSAIPQRLGRIRFQLPKAAFEVAQGRGSLAPFSLENTATSGADPVVLEMDEYAFAVAVLTGMCDPARPASRDSFITFNYDLVLEDAIARLGYRPDYGLSRVQWQTTPDQHQSSVPVLKLHGSANWARVRRRGVRARICRSYAEAGDSIEPVIVPPTWKKGELGPLLQEVWAKAYKAIAQATRLCIIGYSLPETDLYFQYLLTSALVENPGLYGVTVVDADGSGRLEDRYRSLFGPVADYGRFNYMGGGLLGFLSGGGFRALDRGAMVAGMQCYGPG